jgi:hypothetical protein
VTSPRSEELDERRLSSDGVIEGGLVEFHGRGGGSKSTEQESN